MINQNELKQLMKKFFWCKPEQIKDKVTKEKRNHNEKMLIKNIEL